MDDMDSEMKPSMIFSGSSPYKYKPTEHLEAGVGVSFLHSVVAMPQYRHLSIEEIRMEDYNASGGFFGSAFATLGGSLCVRPSRKKLTPYGYGELFKKAVSPFTNKQQDDDQVAAARPVDVSEKENQIQRPNINLYFPGKQNVTFVINSGSNSNVNFLFKDNLTDQSFEQTSSESDEKCTEHVSRRENRSKEKVYKKSVDKDGKRCKR